MSGPSQTPPPPNWGPAPAAPQGWPPQQNPNWSPGPGWQAPMAHMPYMNRPGSMDGLSRIAKVVGLLLLFVGVLVAVLLASVPGSCFNTGANCGPTGTNYAANAATGLVVGKALIVVGLTGFAFGALLKLRGLTAPASGKSEEFDFVIADRRSNGLLLLVSVVLLIVILLTINVPAVAVVP